MSYVGLFVFVFLLAHEDNIWAVAWATSKKDGTESILTGGIDDLVKCWRWLVLKVTVCMGIK